MVPAAHQRDRSSASLVPRVRFAPGTPPSPSTARSVPSALRGATRPPRVPTVPSATVQGCRRRRSASPARRECSAWTALWRVNAPPGSCAGTIIVHVEVVARLRMWFGRVFSVVILDQCAMRKDVALTEISIPLWPNFTFQYPQAREWGSGPRQLRRPAIPCWR